MIQFIPMLKNIGYAGLKIWNSCGPEILTGLGMAASTVGGVMMCRDTLTVNEAIKKENAEIDKLNAIHSGELKLKDGVEYTEAQYRKDITSVRMRKLRKLTYHYRKSGGLFAGGMLLTAIGTGLLRGRALKTAGTVTAITGAFNEYRNSVRERYGEDADRDILLKAKRTFRLSDNPDPTNPEEHPNELKQVEELSDEIVDYGPMDEDEDVNPFLVFYSADTCPVFRGDVFYDLAYLKGRQAEMNNLLILKGTVTKNDVMFSIGHNLTKKGFDLGWAKVGGGDGFVDFGLFDRATGNPKGWVFDYYKQYHCIPLDLNLDGDIREYAEKDGNRMNGNPKHVRRTR